MSTGYLEHWCPIAYYNRMAKITRTIIVKKPPKPTARDASADQAAQDLLARIDEELSHEEAQTARLLSRYGMSLG